MKRLRIVLMVLILATGIGGVASAFAQGMGTQTDVEQQLEWTEGLIRKAADLAREARNLQAGELVKKASEIQMQAREEYRGRHMERAMLQTRAARKLAERAIALMQRPEERSERVEFELQRTDEMLRQAQEEAGPDAPEPVQAHLGAALKQQEQAWELYRSNRLRPALRMSHQVRQTLKRLRFWAQNREGEPPGARLEAVRELVAQAREAAAVSNNERAMQMAQRAEMALRRAEEHMQDARMRPAQQTFNQARRMAEQALRLADEGADVGAYEEARKLYQEQMERVRARLGEQPNDEALRLMSESERHFRLAQSWMEKGEDDLRQAMAEMRIAMRLLHQAGRISD